MARLAGKVAIVTGASNGIGGGIAKALTADGASVVVSYAASREGAGAVVAAITAAGIVGSEMETGIVSQTPLGRAGTPDIAQVVAFLASDAARFVTGENILASGGLR